MILARNKSRPLINKWTSHLHTDSTQVFQPASIDADGFLSIDASE
jgi:hypothetical protein